MNFLDPENWYDLKKLEKEFEELDEEKVKTLHQRLKPYFLRRLKTEVMTDLPPKVCCTAINTQPLYLLPTRTK